MDITKHTNEGADTAAPAPQHAAPAFADVQISEALIRRFDRQGPRYTSYPTADRFSDAFDEDAYREYLSRRATAERNPPLSVYLHLPFCESLCYFCACNKIITQDHSRTNAYVDYLIREMDLVARHLGRDRLTTQLHLGGGTPTFFATDELARLMRALRGHFEFAPQAELGVEIDPRTVNERTLQSLASLGFNRTSFGVQDFDPSVQEAVHRVQPLPMVERALAASREAGFESVNIDLIYGLPRQTPASFARTLDEVIRLSPDRIAVYNYAHLPSRFKAQRLIVESELPPAEDRLSIFIESTQRLLDAGYVYIGLDHFAKPGDELSNALREGSLHRNFQGYTTQAECDLIGFGVSAIGKVGASYSQSTRSLKTYYRHLDAGRLPIERGFALTPDDLLRREVIMTVMCSTPVDFAAIGRRHGIDFTQYFAPELARLEPYRDAGLLAIEADRIAVTPKGRMFVRAIGMVFDGYLGRPAAASYSKLI
ncbi:MULTISPECIES: oxygen-independent coproporphyrinogen III oxidase [Burkholderia]|uniref:Coproporphyrinogen-III oxidase n=1 Tax=Burkholderia savannae TaxID=1637837 RepID=A0ABR5TC37_9BURK|nr:MULTISPECIES: oxygen-independent coproporphyrinogen III oxidase [Burkholderia]AOJ68261.1 coproporphyrinogen III oxidase [Burkholderia savannae]AOJ80335.1 coproporphyrinogen III oxidase [Burkholderia savannae]KVG43168.1 coproporphyrinogen III oxidase [Burkholderia sp. MSMB0265]KVG80010.1 coproporphyrinogen III oxidase [Burkholderia sp. MSMB2040]KVG91935.1 coproporphyrinogen III oxidase [Burkholderia sp. MSMB2042]